MIRLLPLFRQRLQLEQVVQQISDIISTNVADGSTAIVTADLKCNNCYL